MPIAEDAIALGWPVFPCAANKQPLTAHGFKDAATDPEAIRRLFAAPGAAMISVPTGRGTFIAVDLDVKREPSGLLWLEQNRHRLPRTRTIRTGSGGMHLYFQHPAGDLELRNTNSKLAPNVDTRGVGGYVVAPPSPGYTVADDAPIAAMPDWLVAAWTYRPPQPPPAPPRPRQHDSSAGTPYGLAALDAECTAVMQAPFGQQETTLNAAALKIGALVAGNELSAGYARSALLAAGHAMPNEAGREPWTHADVEAKVTRGMADGSARPRQAPERPFSRSAPPPPDDVPPAEDREEPNSTEQGEQATEQDAERAPAGPPLQLVWFHEIKPDIEAKDFVEGVLTEGTMSVVYGESNVGKTFLATDIGLHVSAGRAWMGREVDQTGTLYLAMEGGHGIRNRIAAFQRHHGMDGDVLPFAIVPMPLNLLDPEADRDRIIATIAYAQRICGFRVGLIIGDTLSRAMAGGNENASEDMGALVTNSDAIRAECKAHFMWIHHSGKDQARGARGHSLLRAATDTEIEVTREDGMPPIARTKKQRDLPNDGEFPFILKVIELGTNRRGKAVTSCVVVPPDTDAPIRRTRNLKPSAKAALQSLVECAAENAMPLPPSWGMAAHLVAVKEDAWRERFFSAGMPGAAYDTKRMAWNRGIKDLREMGIVAARNGLAWLTDQSEVA